MLPNNMQPWDYWHLGDDPDLGQEFPKPLYGVCLPKHKDGSSPGYRVATLSLHTIREHDDGTISIIPGDGSSNSVLLPDCDFHGYIDHGVWYEQ